MSTHTASFYLQVEPQRWRYDHDTDPVRGIRVSRLTQERPRSPLPGSVLVQLTIRVPDAAFLPLIPAAVIDIPVSMTDPVPVTVEITDPREEDGT